MILLRLLNGQGIAGLAASLCLALLLIVQKGETRHWHKQCGQFEALYRGEQSAHSQTVANYRAAAGQARRDDEFNAARVKDEQAAVNERTVNDFEIRLADARARYRRLRAPAQAATDSGGRPKPSLPGLSVAAGQPAQAAGQDGLPAANALTATEQAIQLDELIKWVRRQAAVDVDAAKPIAP